MPFYHLPLRVARDLLQVSWTIWKSQRMPLSNQIMIFKRLNKQFGHKVIDLWNVMKCSWYTPLESLQRIVQYTHIQYIKLQCTNLLVHKGLMHVGLYSRSTQVPKAILFLRPKPCIHDKIWMDTLYTCKLITISQYLPLAKHSNVMLDVVPFIDTWLVGLRIILGVEGIKFGLRPEK